MCKFSKILSWLNGIIGIANFAIWVGVGSTLNLIAACFSLVAAVMALVLRRVTA